MTQPSVDLLTLIGQDTQLKKAGTVNGRGPEFCGPCPFCGGKDRFHVQPNTGLWWCRQCSPNEHWQTAADYVMRHDNVDYKEAMRRLGQTPPPPQETVWDYHDADGTVIYQVVRYQRNGEKSYYQRTPDGRKGLNGVTPTIYRLPEVIQAIREGGTNTHIYITEGEKCADALRRIGLVATTNSGGAGKWRPDHSAHLKGANVIILPDNDPPGEKHATLVKQSLQGIAASVRIVRLPGLGEKGDIVDWLAMGKTKDDLLALIVEKQAPPAEYTEIATPHRISGLFAQKPEPVVYYAGGFLREGLGLFVGEPGVGKTPAVMQLGMSIATGTPWLGTVPCMRAKVLYWGIEYSKKELYPLIKASQFGHDLHDDWFSYMTLDDPLPDNPEQALNQLDFYIRVLGYRVIILDVFTGFLPPELRKQSIYRGDYKEMQPYHKLALNYSASILGTWHSTKRESDPRWMHNASTGIWAVPSSRITMYFDTELRVRIHSKPRLGDKIDWALTQERSKRGHRWIVADANPEPVCSPTELAIYRFLKNNSGKDHQFGPSTTAEMVNIPQGTAKSLLVRMYERNLIHRGQSGYYVERSDATLATDASSVSLAADATLATGKVPLPVANATENDQNGCIDPEHQDAPNPSRLQRLHDSLDTTNQRDDLNDLEIIFGGDQ